MVETAAIVEALCFVGDAPKLQQIGFVADSGSRTGAVMRLVHHNPNAALTAALLEMGRGGLRFWAHIDACNGFPAMRMVNDGQRFHAIANIAADEDVMLLMAEHGAFRSVPVEMERWAAAALLGQLSGQEEPHDR